MPMTKTHVAKTMITIDSKYQVDKFLTSEIDLPLI